MKPTHIPNIHSVSKSHGSCRKRNRVLYSSQEKRHGGEKCNPRRGVSGDFMCFIANGFQHFLFVYLKTECCMGRAKEIIRSEWVATAIADNACILPHCPVLSRTCRRALAPALPLDHGKSEASLPRRCSPKVLQQSL